MRRRQFLAGLGGTAAWPLAARAQQERMRRIGLLMSFDENDPEGKAYLAAFRRGLQELGWAEGRNLRIDIRWTAGDLDRMRMSANELVDLQPDAILADTTPVTAALQRQTRAIPVVFMTVSDPVGSGFVASLPRPGGNITGFSNHDASMVGKWLELLTQIAPGIKRVAMMFNPDMSPYVRSYYLPFFEAGARSSKVEPITAPVGSDAEIESAINSLGRESGGGLIIMPDTFMFVRRGAIISLAARNKVIYAYKPFTAAGGLMSYGPSLSEPWRIVGNYTGRVLKDDKPALLVRMFRLASCQLLPALAACVLLRGAPKNLNENNVLRARQEP